MSHNYIVPSNLIYTCVPKSSSELTCLSKAAEEEYHQRRMGRPSHVDRPRWKPRLLHPGACWGSLVGAVVTPSPMELRGFRTPAELKQKDKTRGPRCAPAGMEGCSFDNNFRPISMWSSGEGGGGGVVVGGTRSGVIPEGAAPTIGRRSRVYYEV